MSDDAIETELSPSPAPSQESNLLTLPRKSVIAEVAASYGMEPGPFEQTLRATVMPTNIEITREQFAAFIMVAREHRLNPVTREIFAFPARGGGIVPVVSVDGWLKITNSHPQMNGLVTEDQLDEEGNLVAVTAHIYRKDRAHPVTVREYMKECQRDTDTWRKWPARMLRHKATIQAARYAFGFAGIYDIDEAERMRDSAGAGLSNGEWSDIAPQQGDDTSGQFLNGEVAELLLKDYTARMEACATLEELSKLWASFQRRYYNKTRKRISHAMFGGMEEIYARIEEQIGEKEYAAHLADADPVMAEAAKGEKRKPAQAAPRARAPKRVQKAKRRGAK